MMIFTLKTKSIPNAKYEKACPLTSFLLLLHGP